MTETKFYIKMLIWQYKLYHIPTHSSHIPANFHLRVLLLPYFKFVLRRMWNYRCTRNERWHKSLGRLLSFVTSILSNVELQDKWGTNIFHIKYSRSQSFLCGFKAKLNHKANDWSLHKYVIYSFCNVHQFPPTGNGRKTLSEGTTSNWHPVAPSSLHSHTKR
jgi:hypothetical protein